MTENKTKSAEEIIYERFPGSRNKDLKDGFHFDGKTVLELMEEYHNQFAVSVSEEEILKNHIGHLNCFNRTVTSLEAKELLNGIYAAMREFASHGRFTIEEGRLIFEAGRNKASSIHDYMERGIKDTAPTFEQFIAALSTPQGYTREQMEQYGVYVAKECDYFLNDEDSAAMLSDFIASLTPSKEGKG